MSESERIVIIPGEAGPSHLTAILLCDLAGPPSAVLRETLPGAAAPRPLNPQEIDGTGLGLADLRLYRVRCDGLSPDTAYSLSCGRGGDVRTVQIRTYPAGPAPMRLAMWSCFHDAAGAGAALAASLKALVPAPALKLLVGDNLYLDQPLALGDPGTEIGSRYRQRFFGSGYADALQIAPTYTTWDDHEFWNNYPEKQIWLPQSWSGQAARVAGLAVKALDAFQASLNPRTPGGAAHRSYRIDSVSLASFFVADVRTQRERDDGGKQRMMPDAALDDLVDWAATLDRPGALVLGQPLWMPEGDGFDYNPPRFREQYKRIWQALYDAPFDILVLSGDVHHSHLIEIGLRGGRQVYECVSSPASHIPEGSATVRFPGAPAASLLPGDPRLLDPARDGYVMGTDHRRTFAVIDLFPAGPDAVGVEVQFLDAAAPGRLAPASDATVKHYEARSRRWTSRAIVSKTRTPGLCRAHPFLLRRRQV